MILLRVQVPGMTSALSDVAIRPADQADIPTIEHVARLSWAAAYEGLIPTDIQKRAIAAWYSHEALANAIESRHTVFLLAERTGRVIGFASLDQVSPGAVHLTRIYLLPGDRRLGIGVRLLQSALERVPKETETVTVDVEERNTQARAFYEKCGFVPTGASNMALFGFDLAFVRYQKQLIGTAT